MISSMRKTFHESCSKGLADLERWQVNGSLEKRIPHNLNIAFEDVDAEVLLASLPELALATGSACSAGSAKGSKTLRAIGLPDNLSEGSVRIGFGRTTTLEEVQTATRLLSERVNLIRGIKKINQSAVSLDSNKGPWENHPGTSCVFRPRIFRLQIRMVAEAI